MSDSLYRDRLLDHYRFPRNYGLRGGFDIEAKAANPLCGDSMTMRLKLDNGEVVDVCFESEGCVVSRASASLLFEHIKGKAAAEAGAITPKTVLGLLGAAITPARLKCALLPLEAIRKVV